MDYFGPYELPQAMGLGARTRIIDALEGVTAVVRIIPRPGASVYEEGTTLGCSMIAARLGTPGPPGTSKAVPPCRS
jgi:hypothetical protein